MMQHAVQLLIASIIVLAAPSTSQSEVFRLFYRFGFGQGGIGGPEGGPSQSDVEALICVTNEFLSESMRNHTKNEAVQIFATEIDWGFDNWIYNGSEPEAPRNVPVIVNFTAVVTTNDGSGVPSHSDLWEATKYFDYFSYVMNYVWNIPGQNFFVDTRGMWYQPSLEPPVSGKLQESPLCPGVPKNDQATPGPTESPVTPSPTQKDEPMVPSPTLAPDTPGPTTPETAPTTYSPSKAPETPGPIPPATTPVPTSVTETPVATSGFGTPGPTTAPVTEAPTTATETPSPTTAPTPALATPPPTTAPVPGTPAPTATPETPSPTSAPTTAPVSGTSAPTATPETPSPTSAPTTAPVPGTPAPTATAETPSPTSSPTAAPVTPGPTISPTSAPETPSPIKAPDTPLPMVETPIPTSVPQESKPTNRPLASIPGDTFGFGGQTRPPREPGRESQLGDDLATDETAPAFQVGGDRLPATVEPVAMPTPAEAPPITAEPSAARPTGNDGRPVPSGNNDDRTVAPTTPEDEMVYFRIQIDFFDGMGMNPSMDDVIGMICQVNRFFKDSFRASRQDPGIESYATNIDWDYEPDEQLPFSIYFTSHTKDGQGKTVPAKEVYDYILGGADAKLLVTDYIWNSEPYPTNQFYQTEDIGLSGIYSGASNTNKKIRPIHPIVPGKLARATCPT